jgi:adenine-specific DNA-methyltransferase
VDFNAKGDTFHNEWQSYRTKGNQTLAKQVTNTYDAPGSYCVMVKVIDILGNDTTRTLPVEIAEQEGSHASSQEARKRSSRAA